MGILPVLFALGVLMLIFNLDELFFDLAYFVYGRKQKRRLQISKLYTTAHRRIAIMIPAYEEGAVIGHMLRSALGLINYPLSRYHIFVGVYPNDPETGAAVDEVAAQFPNVHKIVGPDPGPTTKAANLNYVWRRLQEIEAETGGQFEIIVMHDAEDLIHPLSLKLYNYLADKADMVQIPVLPVLPPATLRTFLQNLTMGTYADEFAENHLRHMLVRERIGGFVPSAGVGTALSRRAMELLASEDGGEPFDTRALTEDYVMSLRLARGGMRTLYFLEGIQRVDANGRPRVEYIATREVFPNRFSAAVRQKTRWIYGITMQSRAFRRADDKRSPGQQYLLLHDLKGKFSNLLAPFVFAMPLFLWLAHDRFGGATSLYERLFLILLIANLALSVERQFVRALAVGQYYGWKHALMAVLLPPLFPLRFVWGSLINFAATVQAWRLHLFGSAARKRKWAKTEHRWYMPADLLASSQRRLGDILLEREDLTPRLLQRALRRQARTGRRLGDILVDYHYISEEQLRSALAALNQTWYLDSPVGRWNPEMRHVLPEALARSLQVAPLLALANELVVVTAEPLPPSAFALLQRGPDDRIWQVLAPPASVAAGLEAVYDTPHHGGDASPRLGTRLVLDGVITMPELVDALQEQVFTGQRLGETLVQLGYVTEQGLARYVAVEPIVPTAS